MEAELRVKDNGLGEFYHFCEKQIPYNSDFPPGNSGLRAENAYFCRVNP